MSIHEVMERSDRPIRVTLVQPALAKYRIPVFRELARRPGIELRVMYSSVAGLPNVAPEGFLAVPEADRKLLGGRLSWQAAEWSSATQRQSDVVVLHWSPRSVLLLPALIRARASGVGIVLWGHGYSKRQRGRRRGLRPLFTKLADALVFYEPTTRDEYVADGWPAEDLFVALNSLDHEPIEAARREWLEAPQRLAQFRHEQGLDSGPVVLYVSRLLPANRVDLLVEATGRLARRIPGLKTVIIGNGATERARLEALARAAGTADNVLFVDGIYDEPRLAPWFLAAAVFCYPANVGLSLIHAFWYGLPVVTSDNLGVQNPEFFALQPGVNGQTYCDGNVEALADAVEQIVLDADRRAAMSAAARHTVVDRFTIPRMVDGLEAAIRYAHGAATRRKGV